MIKVKAIYKLGDLDHVYDVTMTFQEKGKSITIIVTDQEKYGDSGFDTPTYADSYEFLENWIVISAARHGISGSSGVYGSSGSTGVSGSSGSVGVTGYASISTTTTILKSSGSSGSSGGSSGSVGITGYQGITGSIGIGPGPIGKPGIPGVSTSTNKYEEEVLAILLSSIRDNKIETLLEEK